MQLFLFRLDSLLVFCKLRVFTKKTSTKIFLTWLFFSHGSSFDHLVFFELFIPKFFFRTKFVRFSTQSFPSENFGHRNTTEMTFFRTRVLRSSHRKKFIRGRSNDRWCVTETDAFRSPPPFPLLLTLFFLFLLRLLHSLTQKLRQAALLTVGTTPPRPLGLMRKCASLKKRERASVCVCVTLLLLLLPLPMQGD